MDMIYSMGYKEGGGGPEEADIIFYFGSEKKLSEWFK